jgi:hypothetical protein
MSVPFGPFALTLDDITQQLRRTFEQFTDPRQGKNTRYPLVDAGVSAFAVLFMQSPSCLEYQRSLEQALGSNNAQTLVGGHHIPSDNQLRHRLDSTAPHPVTPVFSYLFQALNQAGVIDRYRAVNQTLRLALDGTAYCSSHTRHCPTGSTRHHANGQVTYSHTALLPVLVKPGVDKVIPLAPE